MNTHKPQTPEDIHALQQNMQHTMTQKQHACAKTHSRNRRNEGRDVPPPRPPHKTTHQAASANEKKTRAHLDFHKTLAYPLSP